MARRLAWPLIRSLQLDTNRRVIARLLAIAADDAEA
jgi:hypothetical protein